MSVLTAVLVSLSPDFLHEMFYSVPFKITHFCISFLCFWWRCRRRRRFRIDSSVHCRGAHHPLLALWLHPSTEHWQCMLYTWPWFLRAKAATAFSAS